MALPSLDYICDVLSKPPSDTTNQQDQPQTRYLTLTSSAPMVTNGDWQAPNTSSDTCTDITQTRQCVVSGDSVCLAEAELYRLLCSLRNHVIGSERVKRHLLARNIVASLVSHVSTPSASRRLRVVVLHVLGSLARFHTSESYLTEGATSGGDDIHLSRQLLVDQLADCNVIGWLLEQLMTSDPAEDSAVRSECLLCLRALCPHLPLPTKQHMCLAAGLLPRLIAFVAPPTARQPCSATTAIWRRDVECACCVLAALCHSTVAQQLLIGGGVVTACWHVLCQQSDWSPPTFATWHLLTALYYETAAGGGGNTSPLAQHAPRLAAHAEWLLARGSYCHQLSVCVCRCLAVMYRSKHWHAPVATLDRVVAVLATVLSAASAYIELRIAAAEALAYLCETDIRLQRVVSITANIIGTLYQFLSYQPTSTHPTTRRRESHLRTCITGAVIDLYASLCMLDECVRRRVLLLCGAELCQTIGSVLGVFTSSSSTATGSSVPSQQQCSVVSACLRLLLAFSRSLYALRTVLCERSLCAAVLHIVSLSPQQPSTTVTAVTATRRTHLALCILANFLLECSAVRQFLLADSACVLTLCSLTRSTDAGVRLQALWALMNATHAMGAANTSARRHIVEFLLAGSDLFRLVSEPSREILLATLGLLRNLFTCSATCLEAAQEAETPGADHSSCGDERAVYTDTGTQSVMQAIVLVLESENCGAVKEQALCLIANFASEASLRPLVSDNEDILCKLVAYTLHADLRLVLVSVQIMCQLARPGQSGSAEAVARLRELGVCKALQSLQTSLLPAVALQTTEAANSLASGAFVSSCVITLLTTAVTNALCLIS